MNTIEVRSMPEINLICVKGVIRSRGKINRQIIPELWSKITGIKNEIPSVDESRYALIMGDLPGREEEEAFYFAGVRVESNFSTTLPVDFFQYKIKAGEVATTLHVGSPMTLSRTTTSVFRDWLPFSNYSVHLNYELIIFPSDYNRDDPQAKLHYNIYIRR